MNDSFQIVKTPQKTHSVFQEKKSTIYPRFFFLVVIFSGWRETDLKKETSLTPYATSHRSPS